MAAGCRCCKDKKVQGPASLRMFQMCARSRAAPTGSAGGWDPPLLWTNSIPAPEAWPASPPKASTRFPPRSDAYLIVGLQNELTRCGILKNMSDYEDFWKLVREEALGVETEEKLQKIKLKLMNPRPWRSAASRRRDTRMLVTTHQDNGTQTLLDRLTEWRKRCQQWETAWRSYRGPEESKIMCKTKTDSQSETYLSRLYQMYFTSLANMEFSRRLLERDGRFAEMDAQHRARSLLDYMVPRGHTQADVPPREPGEEDSPGPGQQPRAGPALRFLKCQSPGSPQRSPHLKTGRHQVTLCGMSKLSEHKRGKLAPAGVTPDPRATAPLTLAHVIQTHPVVVATALSCRARTVNSDDGDGQTDSTVGRSRRLSRIKNEASAHGYSF
eukprot:XP_017445207.1 PREDICTED: brachyury 2 isoform X6 [Rattus norvegicus]